MTTALHTLTLHMAQENRHFESEGLNEEMLANGLAPDMFVVRSVYLRGNKMDIVASSSVVSWLNLGKQGLYRDLRRLIYAMLDSFDFALVEAAHVSSKPLKLDKSFSRRCAQHGYLPLLKWARGQGMEWDEGTTALAADSGHLDVLQWAREQGCPWDSHTCAFAAQHGHLHVLQWAHKNGCEWDERVCELAAWDGHLHVLQWARARDCPWTNVVCEYAIWKRQWHVLKWARENGCPE